MTTMTADPRVRVIARIRREPEFAMALVGEAVELLADGHAEEARSILRTLANAVGFEALAKTTGSHAKTLHRQLSPSGNPTMNALAQVLHGLTTQIAPKPVRMTVRFVEAEVA
jgi:DNA-binding phage protein